MWSALKSNSGNHSSCGNTAEKTSCRVGTSITSTYILHHLKTNSVMYLDVNGLGQCSS